MSSAPNALNSFFSRGPFFVEIAKDELPETNIRAV